MKTLTYILETYYNNEEFKNRVLEYIQIVLDGIEGEKDPRNIILMFNLVKKVNNYIDRNILKNYSKNFFEILEVYYPIEFTPPKNSPDKITAEDLIDNLNDAFASSEDYMEYFIEVVKGI